MLELLKELLWPSLVVAYRDPLRRLADAIVRRVETGDEVRISTWLTLGKSTGPLNSSAPILTFPDCPLRLNTNSFPFAVPIENRYRSSEAAQFNKFYPQGPWLGFCSSHLLFPALRIKFYSLEFAGRHLE